MNISETVAEVIRSQW